MNDDPPRDAVTSSQPKSQPRVPQLLVERLALGELSAAEATDIRRRLVDEPGGLKRLETIDADNAATLEALPPKLIARRVANALEAEAPKATGGRAWLWGGPVAAFAALGLILVVLPEQPNPDTFNTGSSLPPGTHEPSTPHPTTSGTERAKGAPNPHLVLSRQRSDGGSSNVNDGEMAGAGDVVQVGYLAVGAKFGAIISVDGRGAVTWHLPSTGPTDAAPNAAGGRSAAHLVVKGEQWLPEAYELDDAPKFERFIFVTSQNSFDLEAVDVAARALVRGNDGGRSGRLQLRSGLKQATMTLRKPAESEHGDDPRGSQP